MRFLIPCPLPTNVVPAREVAVGDALLRTHGDPPVPTPDIALIVAKDAAADTVDMLHNGNVEPGWSGNTPVVPLSGAFVAA